MRHFRQRADDFLLLRHDLDRTSQRSLGSGEIRRAYAIPCGVAPSRSPASDSILKRGLLSAEYGICDTHALQRECYLNIVPRAPPAPTRNR
jgi:hypothetical protein